MAGDDPAPPSTRRERRKRRFEEAVKDETAVDASSRDHLVQLLTVIAVPVAVALVHGFSALAVSRWDVPTAGAIVRNEGFSGYLSVVPSMIRGVAAAWWLVAVVVLAVGAATAASLWWKHGWLNGRAILTVGIKTAAYMLPFGLLIIGVTTSITAKPWWPLEQIDLSERTRLCPGYVIGDQADGRWLVVLTERQRRIVYLPADAVMLRTQADPGQPGQDELGIGLIEPGDEGRFEATSCPIGWQTQAGIDEINRWAAGFDDMYKRVTALPLNEEQRAEVESIRTRVVELKPYQRPSNQVRRELERLQELEASTVTTTTTGAG